MTNKKRKLAGFAAAMALLSALSGYYFFLFEPEYQGKQVQSNETMLIAHRGFGNHAPDNSLAAVKLALESGIDGVDLDAQLTADGELVIFHDPSVERLTDGKGKVADLSLEELRHLDIGSSFGKGFAGEQIKTLGEMIQEVDRKGLLIVELKSSGMRSEGIEQKAIDEIEKHDAHAFVYLSSFNPFVLRRIKKLDPEVRTVFIFRDIEPYDPTQFTKIPFFLKKEPWRRAIRKLIQPDLLSIETTVNEKTIRTLQSKGYPIILWTPNNEADLKSSMELMPFAIITDEPLVALSIFNRQ